MFILNELSDNDFLLEFLQEAFTIASSLQLVSLFFGSVFAAIRLPEWEMVDKCKASRVLDCRSVTLSAFCTGWMTVSLYICFACKQQGGNVLGGWQMGQGDSAMSNGDISHLLLRHYSLLVYRLPYGKSIWGEQCDALQGLCWAGCFWIVFRQHKTSL